MNSSSLKMIERNNMFRIFMVSKYVIIATIVVITITAAFIGKAMAGEDFAVTVYWGRMTDSDSGDTVTGRSVFIDAYVSVGTLSWTFARYLEDALSFEIEGQIGKWWGDQTHMEFNLPLAIRWSKFPWNHYVATSVAYGVGPSYATKEPTANLDNGDSSEKFLAYWFGEIALGPPDSKWAGVFRMHHRSGAFGLIADPDISSSNSLAIGLKYRF
jgi:hypothetical protein